MKKRNSISIDAMKHTITIIAALLLAPLAVLHASDVPSPATKPSIVFIYADDWGWGDLSCHGNTWLKTPNIDRLASGGIAKDLSKTPPEITARLTKMVFDWNATLPTEVDPTCVNPNKGKRSGQTGEEED